MELGEAVGFRIPRTVKKSKVMSFHLPVQVNVIAAVK
jgi:hypothetical protein